MSARKIMIAAAALAVSVGLGGVAYHSVATPAHAKSITSSQVNPRHVIEINHLIETGNIQGIRDWIAANPETMQGNNWFARSMQQLSRVIDMPGASVSSLSALSRDLSRFGGSHNRSEPELRTNMPQPYL